MRANLSGGRFARDPCYPIAQSDKCRHPAAQRGCMNIQTHPLALSTQCSLVQAGRSGQLRVDVLTMVCPHFCAVPWRKAIERARLRDAQRHWSNLVQKILV